MMRSLSSAVGGLRSHQTRMDVIGNNIANVNTYGFKSSRVTFSDVYYQTLSGGSRPGTMGGTNPTQIGYGAAVATIDVLNSPSGMSSTDRALDLYINGDGMIAVQDAAGVMRFTRLGVLGFDPDGNLIDPNGNFVMGIPVDADGNPLTNSDGTIDGGNLVRINVSTEDLDKMTGVSIGKNGDIIGVLPGDMKFKLASSKPNWLIDVTIPEDSDMSGNVTFNLEWISRPTNANQRVGFITEFVPRSNSDITGNYTFNYDPNNGQITAMGENGERLTGTVGKPGDDVNLRNSSGTIVMTVKTDPNGVYNNAAAFTPPNNRVNFTSSWFYSIEGTNKGGAKVSTGLRPFTGTESEVRFDGDNNEYGVSVRLDLNVLANAMSNKALIRNDIDNWLTTTAGINSVFISPSTNTTAPVGQIQLGWQQRYVGTLPSLPADFGNIFSNNRDGFLRMIENAADAAGRAGAISYIVHFEDDDGGSPATTTEVSIEILVDGQSIGLRSRPFGTGDDIMFGNTIYGSLTGNILPTVTPTGSPSIPLSGANIDRHTYLYLADAGGTPLTPPMEVLYANDPTAQNIKIGDFTFSINPAALNAAITGTPNRLPLMVGDLRNQQVQNWAFGGSAGSAEAGAGQRVVIGMIALATFRNPAGMTQDGQSYFMPSGNSGEASFKAPGVQGAGTFVSGNLEMSNVEISKEFTDMIVTQRGFQANSRIITVSDEMLQELVNMKR